MDDLCESCGMEEATLVSTYDVEGTTYTKRFCPMCATNVYLLQEMGRGVSNMQSTSITSEEPK